MNDVESNVLCFDLRIISYSRCFLCSGLQGQLLGLLGNLSLLTYFASKKERDARVVQAAGVLETLVVLGQLAMAGAMPSAAFLVTASVVLVGLVLNILNYKNKLDPRLWRLWAEVVTIGGVTVLPQVRTFGSDCLPFWPVMIIKHSFFWDGQEKLALFH